MARKKVQSEDGQTMTGEGTVVTYVGAGEDSPRVINFMGKQKFVRGQAVEITDQELLAKIIGNPSFVEGEVDQESLHEMDEEAANEANDQRKSDKKLNALFTKKHKTPDKDD